MSVYFAGQDFSDAKIGDVLVNWYGESGVIVGESDRGYFWSVRYESGRSIPVRKWNADSIVGVEA